MDELHLVTVDQVKDYCRINAEGGVSSGNVTTIDEILDTLIIRASSFLISMVSRPNIFAQDLVETRNGNGKRVMMATVPPINSVTSVSINGITIPQQTSPFNYGWKNDQDTLYLSGFYFEEGVQNVVITWNCGVQLASRLGYIAQQIILELVNIKWQQKKHPDVLLEKGSNITTIRYRQSDVTDSIQQQINLLMNHVPAE